MRASLLWSALLAAALAPGCRDGEPRAERKEGLDGPYTVSRVVDGDTIHVSSAGGARKVRLVCVDTPETRGPRRTQLGWEAKGALEEILARSEVFLARAEGHDDADRYGRLLRHVFLEDDEHVNLALVRQGWSAYYTKYGPCPRYHARFAEAEFEARSARWGIWRHPDFLEGGYLENARGEEER
jgi:micrococcal nuclease